jgi:phospholipid/cholesterol/gamma-HCH transport system permease protein
MLEKLAALGRFGLFLFQMLGAIRFSAPQFRDTVRQIYVIGARSVPIIAVGGAFVGLVMTLQGYRTLSTFGAGNALGTVLSLSVFRELGPVLTAILFCGRAGSAMAAELGLMRATDQIMALSMMAIDPVGKVAVPRFIAGVISVPLLAAIFCAFAILAGWFEASIVLGVDSGYFWASLQNSVDLSQDYGQTFTKAAVFGAACSLIATHVGYHAEPTIEGTSVATTQAVVYGSLATLFLDFLLSAVFY